MVFSFKDTFNKALIVDRSNSTGVWTLEVKLPAATGQRLAC